MAAKSERGWHGGTGNLAACGDRVTQDPGETNLEWNNAGPGRSDGRRGEWRIKRHTLGRSAGRRTGLPLGFTAERGRVEWRNLRRRRGAGHQRHRSRSAGESAIRGIIHRPIFRGRAIRPVRVYLRLLRVRMGQACAALAIYRTANGYRRATLPGPRCDARGWPAADCCVERDAAVERNRNTGTVTTRRRHEPVAGAVAPGDAGASRTRGRGDAAKHE